jgi:hypothetical protein
MGQVVRHIAGPAADVKNLARLAWLPGTEFGIQILLNRPCPPGKPGMAIFFQNG